MAITESEFAPFGTITTGPALRLEKSQADRDAAIVADRVRRSDLLRELSWTDEDLEAAQQFAFPVAAGRIDRVKHLLSGAFGLESEPFWLRSQIARWREQFVDFARKVK